MPDYFDLTEEADDNTSLLVKIKLNQILDDPNKEISEI